ncbi:hypothetical protein KIPB_008665 [Kipferlia bialata]|uniref:Uncharacterized protein n=1 Tax=Kipferlia bialata TaxID=797122 RepID=A0A9K3D360_9EUKA|nr:hypothetical protein KIPB_008665 [Kipferlia bialata]|eukprot:g8665.t1
MSNESNLFWVESLNWAGDEIPNHEYKRLFPASQNLAFLHVGADTHMSLYALRLEGEAETDTRKGGEDAEANRHIVCTEVEVPYLITGHHLIPPVIGVTEGTLVCLAYMPDTTGKRQSWDNGILTLCLLHLDTWQWDVDELGPLYENGLSIYSTLEPSTCECLLGRLVIFGYHQVISYNIGTGNITLMAEPRPLASQDRSTSSHRHVSGSRVHYIEEDTHMWSIRVKDIPSRRGRPSNTAWEYVDTPRETGAVWVTWRRPIEVGRTLVSCSPNLTSLRFCDVLSGDVVNATEDGLVAFDTWVEGRGEEDPILNWDSEGEGESEAYNPGDGKDLFCRMGADCLSILQLTGHDLSSVRVFHLAPGVYLHIVARPIVSVRRPPHSH